LRLVELTDISIEHQKSSIQYHCSLMLALTAIQHQVSNITFLTILFQFIITLAYFSIVFFNQHAIMSAIKIGIVEDEGITSEVIKVSLQKLNYKITKPAFTYDQALYMFETEKPDLVLLDIKLEEKRDGIDLAKVLRDQYDIPFIFLTANSDATTIARAKQLNPLAFIVKPFSQIDLHAAIEIAFNNYQSARLGSKQKQHVVMMKVGRAFEKINTKDILFLENENHYFNIHFTKGENKSVRASTNEMIDMLPKNQFIRISRTYIVNASQIQKIDSSSVSIGNFVLDYKPGMKEEIMKMMEA